MRERQTKLYYSQRDVVDVRKRPLLFVRHLEERTDVFSARVGHGGKDQSIFSWKCIPLPSRYRWVAQSLDRCETNGGEV